MPISTVGANGLNRTEDFVIDGLTVGTGSGNVATATVVGNGASAGYSNTTAIGYQALALGGGGSETAVGYRALYSESSAGGGNSAFGSQAGYSINGGGGNSAFGNTSLYSTTTGNNNAAYGQDSLRTNTTGSSNVACGNDALRSNTTGSNNTAVGYQALYTQSGAGQYNTAVGYQAGRSITTGTINAIFGYQCGYSITTGTYNTFIGAADAGYYVTTGSKNTILGAFSGNQGGLDIRTASNNIVLSDGDGNPRLFYDTSYTTWRSVEIYNSTSGGGANLLVSAAGGLYRSTSSLKYKTNVQDATHGLNDVLKLRSVTYQGKNTETDGDKVYGGLIAEEVHSAGLTEFVQYAPDGSPDALNYGNMVSLAFKAIQELKAEFDAYKASHP